MIANDFITNWSNIITENLQSLGISKTHGFKSQPGCSKTDTLHLLGCLMHRWGATNGSMVEFGYGSKDGKRDEIGETLKNGHF